jgi:hypothetical protein
MYALRVQINDGPWTTAGADDLGVLTATISGSGQLGPDSFWEKEVGDPGFHFRVGGLTARPVGVTDEHLEWLSHVEVRVGDTVTVEVVQTAVADPVVSGKKAEERKHDERAYFEHCKDVYLQLKDKYENAGSQASRHKHATLGRRFAAGVLGRAVKKL